MTFDPSRVVVAVGAQSSPVTIALLPVLKHRGIPLISYRWVSRDVRVGSKVGEIGPEWDESMPFF